MTEPIPNLGIHITQKGEKLVYCGLAEELVKTTNANYYTLDKEGEKHRTNYHVSLFIPKANLYLREEDYKKLNVRDNGIPWDIEEPEIPEGYRFEVRGYGWNNGGKKSEYGFYMSDRGIWGYTDEASYNLGIDCQFFIELIKEEEIPECVYWSEVEHLPPVMWLMKKSGTTCYMVTAVNDNDISLGLKIKPSSWVSDFKDYRWSDRPFKWEDGKECMVKS